MFASKELNKDPFSMETLLGDVSLSKNMTLKVGILSVVQLMGFNCFHFKMLTGGGGRRDKNVELYIKVIF